MAGAALASLALLLTVFAMAPAAAAPASARVVVIDISGLRWDDVPGMPHLQALMGTGAVGVLSVKTQGETARCGDGLLEISAMTRVPSGVRSCTPDVAALRERYLHNRYDAQVGLLGDMLAGRAAALDSAAAVALSTSSGPAPVTVIDGAVSPTGPPVVLGVDTRLDDPSDRHAAARAADESLGRLQARLQPGTTLMVLGGADGARGGPHLHPLVIAGPGWSHHALTSASTGRAPFVQLFDVGPTVLHLVGVDTLPSSVAGRPMHVSSAEVSSVSSYADRDRHARRALTVGHPTFTVLCAVLVVAVLGAGRAPRTAAALGSVVAAAPVVSWLLQVAAWWRWPIGVWAAALAAGAIVLAAVGWLVSPFTVPVTTAAVLLVGQLAGAPLQLAAPFGDNPIVAGRFHGMGNIAFGVAMGALVLCTAAVRSMFAALALLVVALVIDGAPMLGDDIGGLLTLVVAGVWVVAVRAGWRLEPRRLAVAAVVAVGLAVAVGAADYARPANQQTHAGRFVGQVLHGGAWRVLRRKVDAVLGSFENPIVTLLVVVVAVVVVLLLRRPQPLPLRAAVVGACALALVGTVLNDSGVFVAAATALAATAPVLRLRLRERRRL